MIEPFVRDWFIGFAFLVAIKSLILQIFERGQAWRYGVAVNLFVCPFFYYVLFCLYYHLRSIEDTFIVERFVLLTAQKLNI